MKINIRLPAYVFLYYFLRIFIGSLYRSVNYIFQGYFDLNNLFYKLKINREPLETAFSRYLIELLDLEIIDIGSNYSEFTQAAAPSKNCKITLIDLQRNLCNFSRRELTKKKYKNFQVICGSVGKSDLNQEIFYTKGHSGGSKLIEVKNSSYKNNKQNNINFIPPSEYLKGKRIFIKADIEGSEINLLKELFVHNNFTDKISVISLELQSLDYFNKYNDLIPDEYLPYIPTPFWPTGGSFLRIIRVCLKNSILRKLVVLKASKFPKLLNPNLPLIFYIKKESVKHIQDKEINISLKNTDLFRPF